MTGSLRIVGGTLRGLRFGRPGRATRPTAERVREALASALEARGAIRDARVLDLYAGTGALAFEALSRGAADAVLIDEDAAAARDIQRSAARLGLREHTRVLRLSLAGSALLRRLEALAPAPFDLVFADPPYARASSLGPLLDALVEAGWIADEAFVVVEHAANRTAPTPSRLASEASYRYGDTRVALMRRQTDAAAAAPGGDARS